MIFQLRYLTNVSRIYYWLTFHFILDPRFNGGFISISFAGNLAAYG